MSVTSYNQIVGGDLPESDLPASVSLCADGALVDDPDARSVRLSVVGEDADGIDITVPVDLGIAGQSVSVSVDRQTFVRTLLALSPVVIVVPGERVIDLVSREIGTVRAVHGLSAEVAYDASGLTRTPVGHLIRAARTMEDQP